MLEVTLALVLLTGASLLLKSYWKLMTKDLGFNRAGVFTLWTGLPNSVWQDSERRNQMDLEIVRSLSAMPGVRAVGIADARPLGRTSMSRRYYKIPEETAINMGSADVTPGYFEAMELPLKRGRLFTAGDGPGSVRVALVSEAGAKRFWPEEDPIGKQLRFTSGPRTTTIEVVGVVGDTVGLRVEEEPRSMLYVPHAQQASSPAIDIVVRAEPGLSTSGMIPALRTELARLNAALSVGKVNSLEDDIRERTAQPRFYTTVLASFAFLALALTVTGVGGVVAYLVRSRTYEFGVRLALGATPSRILRLILNYGGGLAAAGLVVGVAGSYALSNVLKAYLYQVEPRDPFGMTAAPVVLLVSVLVACYVPARRAMRIDPAQSLRHD